MLFKFNKITLVNTVLFGLCLMPNVYAESDNTAKSLVQTERSNEVVLSEKISHTINSDKRPKIGLALGGGGMRGAAHAGVLKVLEKEGIPIDCIVGTSMGSVVGGMFAAGIDVNIIEHKFKDLSIMKAFMTVPLWLRVAAAPVLITPRLLGEHPYDGLYKGNRFRKYLVKSVPVTERNIEELKIPFSAVAVSLIDGKPHLLSKGNLGYAMQASCAVPGLRKPVPIEDDLYVDGGVSQNVPVDLCREKGADLVIAVCVDERFLPEKRDAFRKIGSVSKRMITLQLHDIDMPQLSRADIVIHPNVDGIGLISTKKADALRALEAGENAAKEAIPAIKKKLAEYGINTSSNGVAGTYHLTN